MDQLLTGPWVFWAIVLAVGVPVLLVVLTELIGFCVRRGSAAAKPLRMLRNYVIPVAALFALLVFASQSPAEQVWARIVATVLGFLVILLVLSAFNVALFANAKPGTWRERIPSIFVDLARLGLIVLGLAVLFSWVWDADVGGLVAALGVTSIVIGLALQNAVGGIISGLLLLFEQPFKIGDWLDTGSVRGRVVEVNWRAVHLETDSGIQVVPNAMLADSSFTNLSVQGEAFQASTTVTFATDDPPHEVIDLLLEVANRVPSRAEGEWATARYLGASKYTVTIPVRGPSFEGDAVGLFLAWLWYAARRRGLALDGDSTDPVAEPEQLAAAVRFIAPTLQLVGDDLETLRSTCRLERFGTGEVVQAADVVPDALRFVIDGRAEVAVVADGNRIVFTAVEPGDYIGQTTLTREPAFTTSTATETTTVLRMPLQAIDALVRSRPELARQIGQSIETKRRLANEALATAGVARAIIDSDRFDAR